MRMTTDKTEELMRIVSELLHTPVSGANAPKAQDDAPSLSRDAESRIAAILKDGAPLQAGHIQIIGLGALKRKLGDKWPEKRAVIYEVLQSIITRRLSPRDVFFQKSEDEFLLVFAELGADAAKFVCARILQELNLHFLGNASLAGVTVRTAVGVLDGSLVYEKTNMQTLLANFSEVDASMADTAYFKDGLAAEASLEQTWADKSYRGTSLAGQLPKGLKLGYRPMWDAKREVLSTYTVDYHQKRGNALVPAYQAIRDEKSIRAMDVSLLRHAAAQLASLIEAGTRLLLCVPVHYETVLSPALLHDYVKECEDIPKHLRQYILIACDQFPAGVPQSKLALISHAIRPYCRAIAANVEMAFRDFAEFADTGISVTGCYLPAHGLAPETLDKRIRAFVSSATEHGMTAAFLGVNDLPTATVARAAGAHFLEGDVIGRFHEMPGHMVRRTWSELSQECG